MGDPIAGSCPSRAQARGALRQHRGASSTPRAGSVLEPSSPSRPQSHSSPLTTVWRPRRRNCSGRLRQKHRWYHLLQTLRCLLGLWAHVAGVCSVGGAGAGTRGPCCSGASLLVPAHGFQQWHLRATVPARAPARDSRFHPAPNSACGQFCLFRVGEISHQILNFVELVLALLYQKEKSTCGFFFFFLIIRWSPSHW